MADIAIEIKNIEAIKRAFNRAPTLMARELNSAIRKSVLSIERRSMQNTPVDTGRLRASHYTSFGNMRGMVGTNTGYDIFVHEGTKFMSARPYLRKAVDSSDADVGRFFTQAVDDVLNTIGNDT